MHKFIFIISVRSTHFNPQCPAVQGVDDKLYLMIRETIPGYCRRAGIVSLLKSDTECSAEAIWFCMPQYVPHWNSEFSKQYVENQSSFFIFRFRSVNLILIGSNGTYRGQKLVCFTSLLTNCCCLVLAACPHAWAALSSPHETKSCGIHNRRLHNVQAGRTYLDSLNVRETYDVHTTQYGIIMCIRNKQKDMVFAKPKLKLPEKGSWTREQKEENYLL